MSLTMPTPPERQLASGIEPWRCSACHHLMYNCDIEGHPVPGAPMPHFWSLEHREVCTACYTMALTVNDSEHFKKAHQEWLAEERVNKDLKDRQTGKRDYLTDF